MKHGKLLLTFYLKINDIEKIIIDNSVRCFPKSEQTKEKDSKPNTVKKNSQPRKQNKFISQDNTKVIKVVISGK